MFGCGITVLQNMTTLSNIFDVHAWTRALMMLYCIVAFFNYTEAFHLLWLTTLTLTGSKNRVKYATFWSALVKAGGILWQLMKVFPSDSSFIHITILIHHYYFYKNERKVHHNTLKTSTHVFFWIQWCQPTKIMATKGVCWIHFKLNFLERESLPETFNFGNLL